MQTDRVAAVMQSCIRPDESQSGASRQLPLPSSLAFMHPDPAKSMNVAHLTASSFRG